MRARRRLRAARESWGLRVQLVPTAISIALLFVLSVAALQSSGVLYPRVGAAPEVHVVAPGDTVAQIAEKYGTSVATLAELNRLESPDLIFPGQEIRLEAAPSPTDVAGAGSDTGAERIHVVAEGDTLWTIAAAYGVDFEALVERNALPDGDLITIGQRLKVPPPGARAEVASRGGQREDPGGRIWMPFRSQLDGSAAAGSNCGPATLGMLMSYFGEWWTTAGIRRSVNEYQGTWDPDAGSTWEAIAYAARKRGFQVLGLYNADGSYRRWTIDELVEQTKAGRPVMLLTRYWSLPGHGDSAWWGDHYIAFLGLTPTGDVVYHDAAFPDEESGAYRLMSQERLIRAWTRTATGLQYTAMALEWPG